MNRSLVRDLIVKDFQLSRAGVIGCRRGAVHRRRDRAAGAERRSTGGAGPAEARHRAGDVSPALWRDVIATLASVEKR